MSTPILRRVRVRARPGTLFLGLACGFFFSSGRTARAQDLHKQKDDAEQEKRQKVDAEPREYQPKPPVVDAEKERRRQLERENKPPDAVQGGASAAQAQADDAARKAAATAAQPNTPPLNLDAVQRRIEKLLDAAPRGPATDGLQFALAADANPDVAASETVTKAPSLDKLPAELRKKVSFDPATSTIKLVAPLDPGELDALVGLYDTQADRAAVRRLCEPRYAAGKPLFLFLRLYNLGAEARTLDGLPACGSLSRADGLQFFIRPGRGAGMTLENAYADDSSDHVHPPLIVPAHGVLEGVFNLDNLSNTSGEFAAILARSDALEITAQAPNLKLRSESIHVRIVRTANPDAPAKSK